MNARHVNFGSKAGMGTALLGNVELLLTEDNHCVVVRDSEDHAFWLHPDDLIVFEGGKSWTEPTQVQETEQVVTAPTIVKTRRRRRKRNKETGELE